MFRPLAQNDLTYQDLGKEKKLCPERPRPIYNHWTAPTHNHPRATRPLLPSVLRLEKKHKRPWEPGPCHPLPTRQKRLKGVLFKISNWDFWDQRLPLVVMIMKMWQRLFKLTSNWNVLLLCTHLNMFTIISYNTVLFIWQPCLKLLDTKPRGFKAPSLQKIYIGAGRAFKIVSAFPLSLPLSRPTIVKHRF